MHVLFRYDREPCVEPHCLRCTLAFRRPPQLWRYTGLLERSVAHVDLFLAPSRFTLEAHRARGFTRPMPSCRTSWPKTTCPFPPRGARPGQAGARPGSGRVRLGQTPRTAVLPLRRPARAAEGRARAGRSVPQLPRARSARRRRRGRARRAASGARPALDHVRFLGHVPQGELDELYAGRDRAGRPSVGYEVFGSSILEAFARGTPAIVHDLGALPELVGRVGRRTRVPHPGRARRGDRPAPHRPCTPRRARRQGPRRVAAPLERGTPPGGVLRRDRRGPWKPTVS